MSKVLQETGSRSLPSSTETNPRDRVKSISTSEEAKTPLLRSKMGEVDINTLTMKQYLALIHGNQPSTVKLRRDGLTDYLQEQSKPGICSKRLSFKGIVRHSKLQSSLRKSITSSKKVMRHCTKLEKGPPGYYTRVENRPPFGEKKPNLEEIMNKHIEESTRRRTDMEDWMKKLQESMDMNKRNQNASLKNLETQIKQLTKDFQTKVDKEIPSPSTSVGHCKAIFSNNDNQDKNTEASETNVLYRVSFISDDVMKEPKNKGEDASGVFPCQLPPKELNPRCFSLPCTIGSFNVYALADLGAHVNIMPRLMFNYLKLTNLKGTNMLVEMTDMMIKAPIGIAENVLVKIDNFLFPSDFVIIDMQGDPNETMILGRPFFATIHARTNVFNREISLWIKEDSIVFYMNENVRHPIVLIEKVCMINEVQEEESFNPLELGEDLFSYESPLCLEFEKYTQLYDSNEGDKDTFVCDIHETITGQKGKMELCEPGKAALRFHSCSGPADSKLGTRRTPWNNKIDDTNRARRYEEWFAKNNKHQDYESTSMPYLGNFIIALKEIADPIHQENPILSIKSYFSNGSHVSQNNPRPWDYSFKEWLKVKIGYINVDKNVKNAILNEWILYSFDAESDSLGMSNDSYLRDLEEYKSVFDNEIA
ncbi:phospholipase-like protein [Tanacetum coccineum]